MKKETYEEGKKSFEKTGLDWMESLGKMSGYSSKEVEKIYNKEMEKQNQRDKMIDELLNDNELKSEILISEFPIRQIRIQYNNKEIYLKHDAHPDILLFNNKDMNSEDSIRLSYDYVEDISKSVKKYIEKEGEDISTKKSRSNAKEDIELEKE